MKKELRLSILFFLFLVPVQSSIAKILSLSPWGLQDTLPIQVKKLDQSIQFQVGMNGVSPTGGDTDVKFYSIPYQITYGLMEKLEVGASLGVHIVDRKAKTIQAGLTDLSLATRYKIFDVNQTEKFPGLNVEFGLSLPIGSFEKGLGTGATGLLFGWGLTLPTDPMKTTLSFGYRYNLENSDSIQVGSIFSYNLGVILPREHSNLSFFSWKVTALTAELKGFNHSRNKISGKDSGPTPDEFYATPGLIFNLQERYNLVSSALIGLTSESSDFGFNFELRF